MAPLGAPRVARGIGPVWFRRLLVPLAAVYMLEFALGSNGWGVLGGFLPSARFFMQGACLFPEAQDAAIEYRVQAWSCARKRFEELDYRPDFPMHRDDKENRLFRAASFYRQNREVMHALEAFLIARHNERVARGDELAVPGLIGGIRVLSLRIPFPPAGEPVERYRFRPLSEYPESYQNVWYHTTKAREQRWCAGETP